MNSGAMSKLSNLLQSRKSLFTELHNVVSRAPISTFGAEGKPKGVIYADYSIYKGKASMSASPVLPKFVKTESGGLRVDRRGNIMLTFAPAIGERKYDWEKKQRFALSATEVGSLISLGPSDSCEFFHDPSMKSSNAGQVRKNLSIKPHADGSGYFISLNVVNNVTKMSDRFTVPVTTAEFAVMRTAFSFALPRVMGWDRYTSQESSETSSAASTRSPHLMNTEWDR